MEFEPAKLKVRQIVQQVAKCTVCGTDGADNPNCHFQKAAVPIPPIAPFPVHPIPDRPGNVPKVHNGDPFRPAGKGLVPAGAGLAKECHGKLGHPVLPGMAGASLLADP